jgi:leader peptidase (prepilin peptidase) / N-methyltransferase
MEIILVIIAGWMLGFAINYLADVLPESRRFSAPTCPQCEAVIQTRRYFLLQTCQACGKPRSIRTWIVQAVFLAATIGMWYFPPGRLGFWAGTGLLAFFFVIGVIDLEHHLIMHPVSIVGGVIGLLIGIWQKGLLTTLLGGAAGFGIMFALYYLGSLFGRLMSKIRHEEQIEEALGFGDVNLTGILGLMLGWPEIAGALIIAILLGGLVSGIFILSMTLAKKYKPLVAIPYAPFLLLGAMVFLYIPKQ